MKKIFVALFLVLSVLALTLQVFAAPGAFVSSPSGKSAPELIGASNEDDNCVADVVICAYSDRNTLDDVAKANIEAAYVSIVNAPDLVALNSDLGELAKTLHISTDKLSVSELFNVGYSDCSTHDDHGKFSVTVKPNFIENFACLMYYDGSAWVLAENVELDEDAATLTFNMADCAPYAIVVHDGSAVIDDVDAGGIFIKFVPFVGAGFALKLLVVVAVVLFILYKKKEEQ